MSRWLFASISTTTCCALYPIIIIPTSLTFFFTLPGICCCRQFVWASSFILPRLLIWVCYKEPSQTISPNKRERTDCQSGTLWLFWTRDSWHDGKRKTAVQCNVLKRWYNNNRGFNIPFLWHHHLWPNELVITVVFHARPRPSLPQSLLCLKIPKQIQITRGRPARRERRRWGIEKMPQKSIEYVYGIIIGQRTALGLLGLASHLSLASAWMTSPSVQLNWPRWKAPITFVSPYLGPQKIIIIITRSAWHDILNSMDGQRRSTCNASMVQDFTTLLKECAADTLSCPYLAALWAFLCAQLEWLTDGAGICVIVQKGRTRQFTFNTYGIPPGRTDPWREIKKLDTIIAVQRVTLICSPSERCSGLELNLCSYGGF